VDREGRERSERYASRREYMWCTVVRKRRATTASVDSDSTVGVTTNRSNARRGRNTLPKQDMRDRKCTYFSMWGAHFSKCQKIGSWGLGVIGDVFFFDLAKIQIGKFLGTLGDALTTTVSTELNTGNRGSMVGV
jgi:hypothetical protein